MPFAIRFVKFVKKYARHSFLFPFNTLLLLSLKYHSMHFATLLFISSTDIQMRIRGPLLQLCKIDILLLHTALCMHISRGVVPKPLPDAYRICMVTSAHL